MRFQHPALYLSQVPRCVAGWAPLVPLPDAASVRERRSVDLDEWASFVVPAESESVPQLVGRRVLGVVRATGSAPGAYEEYRLAEVERLNSGSDRSVRVMARSLALDLVDAGPIIVRQSSGVATFNVTAELTATQWIDTYILPHLTAMGYTHFARGTVDSTKTWLLTVDRMTPMAVLRELAQRAQLTLYIERNGTTNYLIHLVTEWTGAGRVSRVAHGRQLLQHLKRADVSSQATYLIPTGTLGASDRQRSISTLLWRVSAVDGGTNKLTLGHPDGTTSVTPIVEDDEWNGRRLVRFPLGVTATVVDSWGGSTQQVQVGNVAADGWAIGDLVMVREDSANVRTYPVMSDATYLFRVTAVATNALTMKNIVTGSTTPITTDMFKDLMLRGAAPVTTATTTSSASPNQYVIPDTSLLAVGDIGIISSSAAEPHTAVGGYVAFRIINIANGTTFTVEGLFGNTATPVPGSSGGARHIRFYRPRAGRTRCVSCTATGTITGYDVAGAGIVANDILLPEYDGGYNERLHLVSPSAVGVYGVKVQEYARSDRRGSVNALSANDPFFDDWASSSVLNQWTLVSGVLLQVTAASVGGAYGTYCAKLTTSGSLRSLKPVSLNPGATETLFYGRVRFKTPSNWDTLNGSMQFTCLGKTHVFYSAATSPVPTGASQTLLSGNDTWWEANLPYTYVDDASLYYKLGATDSALSRKAAYFTALITTGGILDAVMFVNDATPPDTFERWGGGYDLFADAAVYHGLYKGTPTTYDLTIADLARMDPDTFPYDEIDVGTSLSVVDEVLDEFSTLRVVAVETNHDNPLDTRVTVNNVRETLTRLLLTG